MATPFDDLPDVAQKTPVATDDNPFSDIPAPALAVPTVPSFSPPTDLPRSADELAGRNFIAEKNANNLIRKQNPTPFDDIPGKKTTGWQDAEDTIKRSPEVLLSAPIALVKGAGYLGRLLSGALNDIGVGIGDTSRAGNWENTEAAGKQIDAEQERNWEQSVGVKNLPTVPSLPITQEEKVLPRPLRVTAKVADNIVQAIPQVAIPIGGLPAAAQRLAGIGFTAYAMSQVPSAGSELIKQYELPEAQRDQDSIDNAWASLITNTGFSAAGVAGSLHNIAAENPTLGKFLTKTIVKNYPPDELRSVFQKVTTGNGTPEEQNLYRFIADNTPNIGQAARKGVNIATKNVPIFDYDTLTKYLGIPEQTKTLEIPGETQPIPAPQPVIQPVKQIEGGQNASPIQSAEPLPQQPIRSSVGEETPLRPVNEKPAGTQEVPAEISNVQPPAPENAPAQVPKTVVETSLPLSHFRSDEEAAAMGWARQENKYVPKQIAPATFGFVQPPLVAGSEPMEMWHLTQPILGRAAGSTVSRLTLEKAGYTVPAAPIQPASPVSQPVQTPTTSISQPVAGAATPPAPVASRAVQVEQIKNRYLNLAQKAGRPMPEGVAAKNAQRLDELIVNRQYTDLLHPDNKISRQIFEEQTGVKLPKTVSGTQKVVAGATYGEFPSKPEGQTQEQRVIEALKTGGAKTAPELAEELDIINHNVRRILGQGTLQGKFERLARGVYGLKNANGSHIYIQTADALKVLPELVAQGVKADLVFLDPPYLTRAIRGGSRGIKHYFFITPEQFNSVVANAKAMLKSPDAPIYYMFSQAPSGLQDMDKYTSAFSNNGFQLVMKGSWTKTFKSGEQVTNVRGKVSEPEGLALFTQSGKFNGELPKGLDFTTVRPPHAGKEGRQSQKPSELYDALLGFSTKQLAEGEKPAFLTLDPFAGTGGLAEASAKAGVSSIAIDIDPKAVANFILPKVTAALAKNVETESVKTENSKLFKIGDRVKLEDGNTATVIADQNQWREKLLVQIDTSNSKIRVPFNSVTRISPEAKRPTPTPNRTMSALRPRASMMNRPPPGGWRPEDKVPKPIGVGAKPVVQKTEIKSPVANLSDADKNEMAELQRQLREQLSRTNVGIDPQILVTATKMANLYVKGGVKSFDQFAQHVHEDLPDLWERLKIYLRNVWNQVADLLGLQDVTKAEAEAVFTNIEQSATLPKESNERIAPEQAQQEQNAPATGGGGGGTGEERPVGRESGLRTRTATESEPASVESNRNQRDLRGLPASNGLTPDKNYVITDADKLGQGGIKAKVSDNFSAIRLVKTLESENRKPTQEEKSVLVHYVGWGGIKGVFDPENKTFQKEYQQLKDLLTPEEYKAARASIQDAHYTSQTIIQRGIYAAMKQLGFTGGEMVEGGVGIGNFIGLMPADWRPVSSYIGIERDPLTAKIAQYLYPEATIYTQGYQEANLTREHFDGAVGNPPFGEKSIYDKNFKEASKHSIHNYFIAKTLELTRPGGVAGFVVSRYFLDSQNQAAREYISTLGEFLGAMRLPNNAFKENANTSVVTDLVFFKRVPKGTETNTDWIGTTTIKNPDTGVSWPLNKWIAENPRMVLGRIAFTERGLYAKGELTIDPIEGSNLGEQLDAAVQNLPQGVYEPNSNAEMKRLTTPEYIFEVPEGVKVGSYYIHKGELLQRMPDVNGQPSGVKVVMKETTAERVKAIIPVRDALNKLVASELDPNSTEIKIETERASLNRIYDNFVKRYGFLNSLTNRRAFYDDTQSTRVLGLERDYSSGISAATAKLRGVQPTPPKANKADIFTKRVNAPYREVTSVDTPKEALMVSLNQRGAVDLDYIAQLAKKDRESVLAELKEFIFETPTGEFQSKEQYLSGNVRQKLQQAEDAAGKDSRFQRNVEALKAVIPADINPTDIIAPIGAPWISAKDVSAFATELTGSEPSTVLYLKANAGWAFEHYDRSTASTQQWGTPRVPFGAMFKILLNGKPVIVYDSIREGDKEVRVVNQQETELANAKVSELKDKWQEWIWSDKSRRDRLARIYNDTYNNYVDFKADGSHLTLPGASPVITLNPHQKNVAWRTVIGGGDGILQDAVVGSGKTFASIAAIMELRRIGRVRKWLVAVPNHLTEQWKDQFNILYPNSNVLAARPSDFTKENRQKLFAKILTGDYDAVILPHSNLKKIGTSPEVEKEILEEILYEIVDTIKQMKDAERAAGRSRGSRQTAQMEKTKDNIDAKIKKLSDISGRDTVAGFEELGFDGLVVDEAHEFKNLFYTTQMQNVAGMGVPAGSAKAFDLYLKTRYLRKRFGGKAPITFLTGTPISNSLVEMFTMQRYLQPKILEDMGLKTLDAWAKVFADVRPVYEVDPTGTGYRLATRLANFQNVGELTAIYRNMADVITMNDLQAQAEAQGKRFPVPKVAGGKPEIFVSERTPEQAEYFGIEQQVLDTENKPVFTTEGDPVMQYPEGTILFRVDNMPDDPRVDNMLKLTNDARKAGLDMRLINPSAPDRSTSKINVAVGEIVKIYNQWKPQKGTQLVFCDLSVPSSARGRSSKIAKTVGVLDIADTPQSEKTVIADDADDTGAEHGISVDDLLADESSFSVYDDMKAKLIKAGIPEREIAFIHDYDTPEKKNKLFGQVNAGDIRVLFGSTAKMGAGTNVQRRIVALHHMDAPWRPSDLEQREGRAIRQGNLFYVEALKKYANPQDYDKDPNAFSVQIKRYATALTYDTRMWQLIEHKAAGIEGFRKADRSTRKIDDIGGEAANASDMKAAASGDPLIQQELQLRNDSNKLVLLKKAWDKNRIALQDRLAYLMDYEKRYKSRIDELDARRKTLADNTQIDDKGKEVFKFTMPDGKIVEEKGVPLTFVAEMVKDSRRGYFGKYRGFDFSFEPLVRRVNDQDIKSVTFYVGKNAFTFANQVTSFIGDEKLTGVGLFQRLDNYLDVKDSDYSMAESRRDSEKKSLEEVKTEAEKVFPKQDELTRLRAEHESVRTQLMNKRRKKVAQSETPEEPAANLGEGLATGEGMSKQEVLDAIKNQPTVGFSVEVISKDEAQALTKRPESRGYGGFFYGGKIYLLNDNIAKGKVAELQSLLREEVAHGLLRTAEGTRQLQSVIDAGKLNLTDAEKQDLRSKGYQEHQLLDEFIAKSARENRPWWLRAIDQIRTWLSNVGLLNLSNIEISRTLLNNIRRFLGAKDDFSSGAEPPAPGEPVVNEKRAQVAGMPEIGQMRPTENIEDVTSQVREKLFDGRKSVSKESTDKAWDILTEMTDPTTKSGTAQGIKNELGGSRIGLTLYKGEILNYALKLAINGDESLLRAMLDHSEDFETLGGGGASTAGSALRGEAEFARQPATKALRDIYTSELIRAAEGASKIDQETFLSLVKQLADIRLSTDEVELLVNSGKTSDGRTIEDLLGESQEPSETKAKRARQIVDEDAQAIAEKKLRQLEQKHSDVEWLKQESKRGIVAKIIADALKSEAPVDVNPLPFIQDIQAKLIEAGVEEDTAGKLAHEIEAERRTSFYNKRVAMMNRAAASRNIRSLIESVLSSPYRAQSDPKWIHDTSVLWFESNGLSNEQAEAATRLFTKQFEAAFQAARQRIGESVLSKVNPTTHDDLMKLIGLGKDWLDKLAEKHGWKKPTEAQFKRLVDLQEKWNDPDKYSPPERAEIMEQMNGIVRHLGNHDKAWLKIVGESMAGSLLSGIRTIDLHLFQPIESLLVKTVPTLATRPSDIPMLVRNLLEAAKNYFPELKFAWQKDAYSFGSYKINEYHNELKRQFEIGVEDWKKGNYLGALRLIYAWQQYVFRALQTANQANMAVYREFDLSLYGSQAMRDAGFNAQQIDELSTRVRAMKEAAYADGLDRGLDDLTARVRADSVTAEQLEAFFANAVGETEAAKIVFNAEADAYSTTGFRKPGLKESDEGYLTKAFGIDKLMRVAQEMRSEGGFKSVLGLSAFGFVNVPLRVAKFNANFFGYGFFRWGVHTFKTKGFTIGGRQFGGGQETPWKQSFANDQQAKQRLREAIVGTSIGLGFLGWALSGNTSADDNSKRKFFIVVTGHGSSNKTLRDAWLKEGYRPNSIVIGLDGKVIGSAPITRVGGALAWPMGISAAHDDVAWAKKDAEANGKPFHESVSAELSTMAGTYYEIIGAQGIFQGIQHFQDIASGGGGMAKVLASTVSSAVSAVVVPGKQLLAGISQMIWGNPDRSSIEAAIAANFPIIGAPWLHPQINRLGDELGDQTWYGKISNLGLPIAFRVSDNPTNRDLYQTLLNKGVAPPDLRRTDIEQRYGALTDAQFTQFAKTSGENIKNNLVSNIASIQQMQPAEAKSFVVKAAAQADSQAASSLGLIHLTNASGGLAGTTSRPKYAGADGRIPMPKQIQRPLLPRARIGSLHRKVTRSHYAKIGKIHARKVSGLRSRKGSIYGKVRRHRIMA
jgi:N12 class adenine-specific DNA methylase/16S rRNA G966 N2-methylase RsmD